MLAAGGRARKGNGWTLRAHSWYSCSVLTQDRRRSPSMRKTTCACLLALGCFAGLAAPRIARAQGSRPVLDLYTRGPYRQEVPRPESLLGYELGSRETTYWEQDRVVHAIADAAKDRMRIIPYGQSVEGR